MPEQKTVRVRIAVAIAVGGSWNVAGWSNQTDSELRCHAVEGLSYDIGDGQYVVHYVEADIPIPEPQTIEGTVQ